MTNNVAKNASTSEVEHFPLFIGYPPVDQFGPLSYRIGYLFSFIYLGEFPTQALGPPYVQRCLLLPWRLPSAAMSPMTVRGVATRLWLLLVLVLSAALFQVFLLLLEQTSSQDRKLPPSNPTRHRVTWLSATEGRKDLFYRHFSSFSTSRETNFWRSSSLSQRNSLRTSRSSQCAPQPGRFYQVLERPASHGTCSEPRREQATTGLAALLEQRKIASASARGRGILTAFPPTSDGTL